MTLHRVRHGSPLHLKTLQPAPPGLACSQRYKRALSLETSLLLWLCLVYSLSRLLAPWLALDLVPSLVLSVALAFAPHDLALPFECYISNVWVSEMCETCDMH